MLNAVLLKRAMNYLQLSGVALAEKVSALREDGKRTAPETISRWLNGTRPVDPFLMGWIAELVRSKLASNERSRFVLPNGRLVIAVANLKGGVGKTTLARNLAAVAKSLHLKSTFLYAEYPEARRRAGYVFYDLKPLNINCPELTPEEILGYEPGDGEVVIVDVCNSIAQDSFFTASARDEPLKANPQGFLARFNPDIYVIPGEFASSLDNWGTQRLIESNALQAPVQLLHRPSLMCMDFAATASQDGFDVTSQMFCPFFIPQSVSASSPLPRDFMSEWQNLDQKHHHFRLFEHLLSQVGGEVFESYQMEQEMKVAGLEKLLDWAEAT
ncbi:ParA family protein [Pseudomonas tolaasii]|uniref:ParA family protein n=1 Tax=Pseudomonas tolaasii TaxID=29442 RepID=UPI00037883A0|nr:ParA family protein [Pseudomonas tolaasii]